MKKITFLLSFLTFAFLSSAQSKITFEDQTLNGAEAVYGGTVSVVANPVVTGINTSANCLDVVNNGYAPIKFSNFAIPTGAKTSYPYVKIKFKIAYKAYNGGTDLDYPQIDVFSSATAPALTTAETLGSISSAWGSHTTDSLVWKNAEFIMSSSALTTIPDGILVVKVAKSKCEYLLDDIEIIPSPIYNTDILTLADFESNAINDTYTTANIYGGTVASTAIVNANPTSAATKSLYITSTSYNQVARFNVTLPSGVLLTDYDRLYFDRYSTAVQYTQIYLKANSTTIYADAGYPSQGAATTWVTKDYELSSSVPAANTFTLDIGYSINNGSYYLDNVKLHRKTGTITSIEKTEVKPLVMILANDRIQFAQVVSKVSVYNIQGKIVLSAQNASELNTEMLRDGVYVVKAIQNGQNFISKFVK